MRDLRGDPWGLASQLLHLSGGEAVQSPDEDIGARPRSQAEVHGQEGSGPAPGILNEYAQTNRVESRILLRVYKRT